MKLDRVTCWLDRALEVGKFDDVSNNGVQIARRGEDVDTVAFAVDASVQSVRAAAEAGAQLLVVHHGISWGGGIRRVSGGVYEVIRAAMDANLAVYACHLPLDANRRYGNNWELARKIGLTAVRKAFSYHGNVIGVVGRLARARTLDLGTGAVELPAGKIGVCSGGAGEFAEDAARLGCDAYVTGEASWGDVIAAENVGMRMLCLGHYETETFGVRALSRAVRQELGLKTVDIRRPSEAAGR